MAKRRLWKKKWRKRWLLEWKRIIANKRNGNKEGTSCCSRVDAFGTHVFSWFSIEIIWVVGNFFENDIIQNDRKYWELLPLNAESIYEHTKAHTNRETERQAATGTHRPKRKYQSLHIAIATLFLFSKNPFRNQSAAPYWSVHVFFAKQKQHKNSFGLHSFVVWWARDENPNIHTKKREKHTD